MNPRAVHPPTTQASLFAPLQPLPHWEMLPPQNRQEALALLIQLLLQPPALPVAERVRGEVDHE